MFINVAIVPKTRTRRGTLLIDVMCALFILAMGTLAIFSTMPASQASQRMATDQAAATYMASKYIEQLQILRTSQLSAATLSNLNLIDAGQTGPPYSFAHVPLDDGSYYSPATRLKDAVATVNFTNIDAGSVRCDVFIQWRTPHNVLQTLSTGTIIGGYK